MHYSKNSQGVRETSYNLLGGEVMAIRNPVRTKNKRITFFSVLSKRNILKFINK